ncbi:MAG: hypothetical protein HZA51_04725 [Planctomycetes bacterium]|nr:hypothetical protein [Planctomycetota bacterium]
MTPARISCLALSLVIVSASTTTAGVILDRQPHNTGGPSADTAYLDGFGDLGWQEVAEDFALPQQSIINRIDWWGFYGSSFGGGTTPPISDEVFRIRIYSARVSDGFPGAVIHEEYHTNPMRTLTGRNVSSNSAFPERKYRADLTTPIALEANTTFWLNITQIGAPESKFRWEYSLTPPAHDFAFLDNFSTDWELAGAVSGLAFQLYDVPEPGSMSFFAVIAMFGFSVNSKRAHGNYFCRRQNHAVTDRRISSRSP